MLFSLKAKNKLYRNYKLINETFTSSKSDQKAKSKFYPSRTRNFIF